jgi:hypothetical protein
MDKRISNLLIIQKQTSKSKKFDINICVENIGCFTNEVFSIISDLLKKEIDRQYLGEFEFISASCLVHFSKFWEDWGYHFECPNITVDFKNYKNYVLEVCNGYKDHPNLKNEQVWLVLVTTIYAMNYMSAYCRGEFTSDIASYGNLRGGLRKLESLLVKFKLPPVSSKPKSISKASKVSTISMSITKDDLNNNFERFGWQDMEDIVGELFEKKGYVVTITPPTGDFGIDVEARNDNESIGIQVKHWNNDVGYEDLAKTLGSSMGKYNKSIIINTKSGFTSQAWQKQSEMPYVLELWDSTKLKNEFKNLFSLEMHIANSNGKFCTQCGTKIISNAKFCHECGATVIQTRGIKSTTFDDSESFDYDQGFNINEVYDQE